MIKNARFKKFLSIFGFLIVCIFIASSILFNSNPLLYIKNVIFGYGGFINFDKTAPKVLERKVEVLNPTKVQITWKTNESSISWLIYGKGLYYDSEIKIKNYTTSHSIILADLSEGNTYHFQILTEDEKGNRDFDKDQVIDLTE